jgi:hypothetical protein
LLLQTIPPVANITHLGLLDLELQARLLYTNTNVIERAILLSQLK